ncbi:L-rhamnose mutarotase [Gammaproteobacteria bacterium]|nr:L-rhamnose mutarotase [Gammaproteobacteria bacterium]
MIRKAFLMQVNPEYHAQYEQRHNPIWDELATTLKDHGAHHYSIFLDDTTHQLFGYVEIESEERWNAVANTEVCQKWWVSMQDLMPHNADASPISCELRSVFYLD